MFAFICQEIDRYVLLFDTGVHLIVVESLTEEDKLKLLDYAEGLSFVTNEFGRVEISVSLIKHKQ